MKLTWYLQKIDWECDHRNVVGYFPFENDGTSVAVGVCAQYNWYFMVEVVWYGWLNG